MSKSNKLRTATLARAAGQAGGTQTSGTATSLSVTPAQGSFLPAFTLSQALSRFVIFRFRTHQSDNERSEGERREREVVCGRKLLICGSEGSVAACYTTFLILYAHLCIMRSFT